MAELRKLSDSKYLRSLLFINCGGDIDMSSQWFFDSSEIKTYIMDCHRPYFHGNVNDPDSKNLPFEREYNSAINGNFLRTVDNQTSELIMNLF